MADDQDAACIDLDAITIRQLTAHIAAARGSGRPRSAALVHRHEPAARTSQGRKLRRLTADKIQRTERRALERSGQDAEMAGRCEKKGTKREEFAV